MKAREGSMAARFGWFAAERVVRLAVGFLVGVAVARHLGPADFGMLSYGMAVVAIFMVIFGGGIDALAARDLSLEGAPRSEILGTALVLRLGLGVAGAAVCAAYGLLVFSRDDGVRALVLVQSMFLVFGWGEVLDAWFQSRANPKVGVCVRICGALAGGAARVCLIGVSADVFFFALAGVCEAALVATGMWFACTRSQNGVRRFVFERGRALDLLRRGGPLVVSSLLVAAVMQGDRIMLGQMAEPDELGVYAASARFLDVLMILPVMAGSTVQRLFARNACAGSFSDSQEVTRAWAVATWAALLVSLGVFVGAPWIMKFSFGESFGAAAGVLAIHGWVATMVMQVSLRTRVLVAEGAQGMVVALSLATAGVQLALLPIAIMHWGAVGAAASTLVAWTSGALLWPLLFARTRRFVFAFFGAVLFPLRKQTCRS